MPDCCQFMLTLSFQVKKQYVNGVANLKRGEYQYLMRNDQERQQESLLRKTLGKIKEMIPEGSSIPIRTVADRIDLSYTSARKIIRRDLRMKKKVAKWIPHVLTNEQKHCRLELSSIHRQRFSTQEFLLDRIVTGDESWCYHYDPEIKNQSKRWCKHGEPAPKMPRRSLSAGKILLSFFFDSKGPLLIEFSKRGV